MCIEVFWTGGFDSTFRVCQLSKKSVIIHPYYLSDNRLSESYELNAIEKIRDNLLNNPETKAIIEPIKYVSMEQRHSNSAITEAFRALRQKGYLGSQYEWLGVFAAEHKGIELSIHKDDKAIELINKLGKLELVESPYGHYYRIDKNSSELDLVTLFGNMSFPLAEYTKVEMKQKYISMGLGDIIDDTWFCHTPIDGKPCGCCNPCRYTIEEGMSDRFTPEALTRYRNNRNPVYRAVRKIKRRFHIGV